MDGAVFLDRDGVINENRIDYVKLWSEFKFLPGSKEAIVLLKKKGFKIIVVTNQSVIGRKLATKETVEEIHDLMQREMGLKLDGIYYCPHHPDAGCVCRKPKTYLILKAAAEKDVGLDKSWVIGDHITDVEMGRAVGCKTILILNNRGRRFLKEAKILPDFFASSLFEATSILLKVENPSIEQRRE